jgi:hypothetical protein
MGNGEWEIRGKRGTGTGLFKGLTWLLWVLNAVPVLRKTVRGSPNIANLPSRIRKAPE